MSRNLRGPRSQGSFRRKPPRFSGDLFLIVCEGAKTEPNYFKAIKKRMRIHPLQVEICGEECGSDPRSVVEFAKGKKKRPHPEELHYDQVWCVIDKDKHPNLIEALDMARANQLKMCLSIPCFEFWYLLHFEYTTRPFENADLLIHELKKHLSGSTYTKNKPPMTELMPQLEAAIKNAQRVREANKTTAQQNPRTDVDLLIGELKKICPRK